MSSGVNLLTNSLKISDVTKADFYNSIYLEFKEKERNSFPVMTWAMFRTR